MTITPPLDITKLPDVLTDKDETYFEYTQVPGDEDVQVVNGVITVVGVNPGYTEVGLTFEDSIKAYDFTERANDLVNAAVAAGCTVTGGFDGDGEESGDFWRIVIEDGRVVTEDGSVLFPSDVKYERAVAWKQAHDEACVAMACLHKNPYGDPT